MADPQAGVGAEELEDAAEDALSALSTGNFESGGGFDDCFDAVAEPHAIEPIKFGDGLSWGADGTLHVKSGEEEFEGFCEQSESGELAEEDADDGLQCACLKDGGGLSAIFEGHIEQGAFAKIAEQSGEAGAGFFDVPAEDGSEHAGDVSIE